MVNPQVTGVNLIIDVISKLAKLKRGGFVSQRGHTYVLNDDQINVFGIEDTLACIGMIKTMAKQFDQLESDREGVQNGHKNRPQSHQPDYITVT